MPCTQGMTSAWSLQESEDLALSSPNPPGGAALQFHVRVAAWRADGHGHGHGMDIGHWTLDTGH